MTKEILLADDDRTIRQSLTGLLADAGYVVRTAKDGREALDLYRERRPDLLLLDVMMPKSSGYDVCAEIRQTDSDTPIVMLTALDAETCELQGLDAGADGYVVKTVSGKVLLARIAAVLRHASPEAPQGRFDFAGWHVDPASLNMVRGGTEQAITERELAMMRWFAMHPGEVMSRDSLSTRFWGMDFDGGENALTMAIGRLRRKLGRAASALVSVRGSGYVFRQS